MSSAVAELEAGLQAMLQLKPPGVSGSKIQSLTSLCLANVQSESVLIQKLYTHFKKAPGSHKLGVLYVVDSVTRKWAENAKNEGQAIASSAPDGTYAAGVHRVTELLPVLMNDITQSAPDDQKDKIKKLIDIWEKGQTFPMAMLSNFKEKLVSQTLKSTTPDGSPPRDTAMSGIEHNNNPVVSTANTSSILAALANIAKQNTAALPTPQNYSMHPNPQEVQPQSSSTSQVGMMNSTVPFPASTQPPVNVQSSPALFVPPGHGQLNSNQGFPSNPAFGVPPTLAGQAPINPNLQQQILVLKTLAEQGVPQAQWATIMAALNAAQAGGGGGLPALPQPPVLGQNQNQIQNQNGWQGAKSVESRDRNGYVESPRSPSGRYRRRSRSISPPRTWTGARDSPNSRRRDDVGFDDYQGGSPGRGHDNRNRGGNEYRQRSPQPRRGRSPTPPRRHGSGDKWVEFDPSIGKGNIKVLSRTLFVGGVTGSEQELRGIFNNFGTVQTCIVNKDKRHAFVKMVSRKDAITAKEAMESHRSPDSQLRTRWGVGFGPRDCSDYQTGISIIPINKLTDADRKWMLTAEYGGSGGKPIEGGMVVEEPDIEIGQGVSSKAISRRMQTDKGGNSGPKSSRDREDEDQYQYRRPDRRDEGRNTRDRDSMNSTAPPPVPGFPYNAMPTFANGMPMFPPGFQFPGQP